MTSLHYDHNMSRSFTTHSIAHRCWVTWEKDDRVRRTSLCIGNCCQFVNIKCQKLVIRDFHLQTNKQTNKQSHCSERKQHVYWIKFLRTVWFWLLKNWSKTWCYFSTASKAAYLAFVEEQRKFQADIQRQQDILDSIRNFEVRTLVRYCFRIYNLLNMQLLFVQLIDSILISLVYRTNMYLVENTWGSRK